MVHAGNVCQAACCSGHSEGKAQSREVPGRTRQNSLSTHNKTEQQNVPDLTRSLQNVTRVLKRHHTPL